MAILVTHRAERPRVDADRVLQRQKYIVRASPADRSGRGAALRLPALTFENTVSSTEYLIRHPIRSEDYRLVPFVHRCKHIAELVWQTESTKRQGLGATGHTVVRLAYVFRYSDHRLAQISTLIRSKCWDDKRLDCATPLHEAALLPARLE